MEPKDVVNRLKEWGDRLENLRERLEESETPRDVLEEFKRIIDNLRITLWAVLSLTESELAEGVAHFRMKRTEEMCRLVRDDVQKGRITGQNPDLGPFRVALKDALASIETIQPG
jgi:hypothetical protein